MKRILTIFMAITVASLFAQARTVSEYFGDTQADMVFPSLTAVSRLEMVYYFQSGMSNPTQSELGGFSRVTSLSDTCLTVDCGESVRQDLVLLPGKKPVLMLIETLALPEHDSRVRFFDSQWQELKNPPLKQPQLADWLVDKNAVHRDEVEYVLPFMLSTARFNPEDMTLTYTSTADSYFAGEKPAALKYLRPKLVYRWDGKKFRQAR